MTPIELATQLGNVPRHQIPALVAALLARLIEPEPQTEPALAEDTLLSADQVAERLQVDRKWVYAHRKELGGVSLSRKRLRFPSSGVDAYIRRRKAATARGGRDG